MVMSPSEARRVVDVALRKGWARMGPAIDVRTPPASRAEQMEATLAYKREHEVSYKAAAAATGVTYKALMDYVWKKQQATLEAGRRERMKQP